MAGPSGPAISFNFYPRSPCGERRYTNGEECIELLFLSTLSLRRATPTSFGALKMAAFISIHALLAESDPPFRTPAATPTIFLSTLSLRRATSGTALVSNLVQDFYPRSPCGERRTCWWSASAPPDFYPRSPCGERRRARLCPICQWRISIHALLAESDATQHYNTGASLYFYPRSPCGERHTGQPVRGLPSYFYPRSPCGERPIYFSADARQDRRDFYPRSPCGERPVKLFKQNYECFISIHALLAESDSPCCGWFEVIHHFYPRSPCGERQVRAGAVAHGEGISIHALLAESDFQPIDPMPYSHISIHALLAESDRPPAARRGCTAISIHALLAESDLTHNSRKVIKDNFYPRSPCGERPTSDKLFIPSHYFYPRSPCGERPRPQPPKARVIKISIHALLAESDHHR